MRRNVRYELGLKLIKESKKINDVLNGMVYNTKKSYETAYENFLEWLNKQYPKEKLDTYIKDIRLLEPREKLTITDRYEKDIKSWLIELKKEFAPKTINTYIVAIKGLFEKNRIDLDKIFWKEIKSLKPGKSPVHEKIIPTPAELKNILQHAPDVRAKSFFSILATSGLRIGELCNLKMDDINLKTQVPRITIRNPKTDANEVIHKTRMSFEAKASYLEYLKVRQKIMKTAILRSVNLKIDRNNFDMKEYLRTEERAYPFTKRTMEGIWRIMLRKSKYAERDTSGLKPRVKRTVHSLRGFFVTNFSLYNENLAEYFVNHVSELKETYNHKSEEWLDQEYLNGCKYLAIFEAPQDTSDQIKSLNEEMDQLQKDNEEMKAQILELRLEKLEKANGIKKV